MLRSMYSGVSGMRGFQTKLDVIGNNIANVNTVGFKSSRVMFQDILSQTVSGVTAAAAGEQGGVNPRQIGLGAAIASIDTVHTGGSAMTTNVPTDLRINGDGFFVLQNGPDGEQVLTRSGNFMLDAAGQLVNGDGMFVLDTAGEPIQVDTATVTSFTIAQNGMIIGATVDGPVDVAQIGLIRVTNPGGLEKLGGSTYRMTLNANLDGAMDILEPNSAEDGTGAIISGQLEMSNVDLTSEFTEMIVAQRGFQANSRIITTSDEILQEVVNLKR